MSEVMSVLFRISMFLVLLNVFAFVAERLLERMVDAYRARNQVHSDKAVAAHREMQAARYRSLGVNCQGHCYLFGCKYESITDELYALGYEQDVIERLVETINSVPHRQPCDCGKALLPLLEETRAAGQETLIPHEEQPCDTPEQ